MLATFLFTATRNGKNVTEKVEAENLSAAKYKLEIQGYSNIEFLNSELSRDYENLFDENQIKKIDKIPAGQRAAFFYRNGIKHIIFNALKATAVAWLPMLAYAIYSRGFFSICWLVIFSAIMLYIITPGMIYHQFVTGHFWANNRQVRFWAKIANLFNFVSFNKIPEFELDSRLAFADAREGNLDDGLRRLAKHQSNPKVSERIFNNTLSLVYSAAQKYDESIALREKSLQQDNVFQEELLDYAIALSSRQKRTREAREVVSRVMAMELSVIANIYLPYCQGIIEIEENNLPQAEFYLRQTQERLKPFAKNSHFDGLRYLIKALLAIALGNQGNKDEAQTLFNESRKYLIAQKESNLIERCEKAVA